MRRAADPGPVFAALADPTRRFVVRALAAGQEVTVTELADRLPMSRQAVTKHLVTLAQAGLVSGVRRGRERRYHLVTESFDEATAWMADVGGRWDRRLADLKADLESPGSRRRPMPEDVDHGRGAARSADG